uniref:tripartite tricarboxylate transporter permease n=1 Tax=Pararhizobium sp. IMCC3301 TaxID=3067904 RepID=UPI00274280F6|nr:tripartite tricarboxylate transporter permease [Pararhizobium sp. IMCC3301]
MEFLEILTSTLDPMTLFLVVLGTLFGIVIGVLPGMGPTVACAVVLPFTAGMEPLDAITLLVAIYCAGTYGGSVSAILINTPGTPASVATALDGYPLAQKGQAGRALGIATVSSAIGGLVAVVIFILSAPALAKVAYQFGPAEYFALTVFGLCMLTTIGGDPLKSMISGLFGILLATIGLDIMTGVARFTFNNAHIADGLSFVPVLVGLFAISEFLLQSTRHGIKRETIKLDAIRLPSRDDYRQIWKTILRGTGIGTFVGILPAEGGTVAAIMSYNEERRWSKTPEDFGKGSINGIAAAESANNAATAGAMVPTLALGIPGGGTTAVILAALVMHGLRPGPQLFLEQAEFFYGIGITMALANICFFVLGLYLARHFAKVTLIPAAILWPIIAVISVVGIYSFGQSMFDVAVMLGAGVIGFFMKRYGFSPIALAIGLVLGGLVETTLRQSLVIYDGNALLLFSSPLAVVFFVMAALALLGPMIKKTISRLRIE